MMKVYIKPGCPWCVDVIAYLKKEGFEFEQIDVIANRDMYDEMIAISGQSSAPTMTVGDNLMLPDFGVDELKVFLNQHEIEP